MENVRSPDLDALGVSMTSLAQKATTLLELHKPGNPVVLPTVWDAWSATVAAASTAATSCS